MTPIPGPLTSFKAHVRTQSLLDGFDENDFTFTSDETVENLLLARLTYREEPSLGDFEIPRVSQVCTGRRSLENCTTDWRASQHD